MAAVRTGSMPCRVARAEFVRGHSLMLVMQAAAKHGMSQCGGQQQQFGQE